MRGQVLTCPPTADPPRLTCDESCRFATLGSPCRSSQWSPRSALAPSLILPGLVAFTLLALTGAAVNFEQRSGIGALWRSTHVVRRHFWPVFMLATLRLFLGDAVIRAVEALVQHHLAEYFLVRLVAEGTGAAVCGLMQSGLG